MAPAATVRASVDLVVLGAGPAGLTAAWRAARRGLQVVVLDRAGQVGGMATSFEVAGVRVDYGSHRLHPATDAAVLADLRNLLGSDLQTRTRNGRLRIADRWVRFPLRAGELATRLPRALVLGAARDAALAPLRRERGSSYASVLRRSLGPTLYDAMYGPYAHKLWGVDGDQIDAEQARRRVSADTPWKLAVRIARGGRARAGSGQGAVFHYPRLGFGQLADAVAASARASGATIITGAEVTDVQVRPGDVRVTWDGGAVRARQMFSTLPVTTLGRITRPAPSAQVVQDATGLQFRAMALVYLVHESGRWTEYDAHYLPGRQTPITRVSEPANYRVSADDPPGRSVLCVEIPCAAGDGVWTSDDDALGALARAGLAAVGLPPVRQPRQGAVVVRRLPHVYPVYATGYAERLAGLQAWADRLPNVVSFGRLGLFVHDNTHHAMRMAYDAVDCLGDDGRWDAAAWARARHRFAGHVVED